MATNICIGKNKINSNSNLTDEQIYKLDKIISNGNGNKFLNDKLEYIEINNDELLWDNIKNRPFDSLDIKYFNVDSNNVFSFNSNLFDDINSDITSIKSTLNKKIEIDDTLDSSSTFTWSIDKIKNEFSKLNIPTDIHTHTNLSTVLDKLNVDSNNNLLFDTKTLMSTNIYDLDNDGKIDNAKVSDTINGLLSTITELNYLQGVKSNIQSQIDAIIGGVSFKGEYSTYADMVSSLTSPKKGDWVYILNDENKSNQANTQYVYSGTDWIYGGGRTLVNDASSNVKGIIQLSGDLSGTSSSPQLATITTSKTIGYVKSITIDEKGRVKSITEDNTLSQRISDLESRPQIYVSTTQPTNLKNGDFWIEG